ncbi:MAG: hypothetical protein ACOZNI_01250, partial [Myxococcota bacterium]
MGITPFLALTFAGSWGLAVLFHAFGVRAEGPAAVGMAIAFLSTPILATALLKRRAGEPFTEGELVMGPWLAVAWVAPIVAAWAAALLAHALGWGTFELSGEPIVARVASLRGEAEAAEVRATLAAAPVPYPLLATVQALVVGVFFYAPLAFLEEVGWRGYLWRRLRPL